MSQTSYTFEIKYGKSPPVLLTLSHSQSLEDLKSTIKARFSLANCKLLGKPPFAASMNSATTSGAPLLIGNIWGKQSNQTNLKNKPIPLTVIGTELKEVLTESKEQSLQDQASDSVDMMEDTDSSTSKSYYSLFHHQMCGWLDGVKTVVDTQCAKKLMHREDYDNYRVLQLILAKATLLDVRSAIVGAHIDYDFRGGAVFQACVMADHLSLMQHFCDVGNKPFKHHLWNTHHDNHTCNHLINRWSSYCSPVKYKMFGQIESSESSAHLSVDLSPLNTWSRFSNSLLFLTVAFGRVDFLKYFIHKCGGLEIAFLNTGAQAEIPVTIGSLIPKLFLIACRYHQKKTIHYLLSLRRYLPYEYVMTGAFIACRSNNLDLLGYISRRCFPYMVYYTQVKEAQEQKHVLNAQTTSVEVKQELNEIKEIKQELKLSERILLRQKKSKQWQQQLEKVQRDSHMSPEYRCLRCAIENEDPAAFIFCVDRLKADLSLDHFDAITHLVYHRAFMGRLNVQDETEQDFFYALFRRLGPAESERIAKLEAFDPETDTNSMLFCCVAAQYYHNPDWSAATEWFCKFLQLGLTVSHEQFQQLSEAVQQTIKRCQLLVEQWEQTGKEWTQLLSLSGKVDFDKEYHLDEVYKEDKYLVLPKQLAAIVSLYVEGTDGTKAEWLKKSGDLMIGTGWRTEFESKESARKFQEKEATEKSQQQEKERLKLKQDREGIALPGLVEAPPSLEFNDINADSDSHSDETQTKIYPSSQPSDK